MPQLTYYRSLARVTANFTAFNNALRGLRLKIALRKVSLLHKEAVIETLRWMLRHYILLQNYCDHLVHLMRLHRRCNKSW